MATATAGIGLRRLQHLVLWVSDVERSVRFYRDVLGFEVGLRDARRPWVFMRAGTDGMIVLQEQADVPQQHFAFTVTEGDIAVAAAELRRRGIAIEGPMVHEWIPAKSLYFADPDGHDVELCAPLPRR